MWRDQKRSAKKGKYACREKGTFQIPLHKSWAWQQIPDSQSTCPDTHSHSMQYFCTRVLPSLPALLPTRAVWLGFSCCHSNSWPRFSVEHTLRFGSIARMNEHRWRGLVDAVVPFIYLFFFLHTLNLKLSCPLAFPLKYFGPFNFLHRGWCQHTQSHFSAEWWWALVRINLSSHKMKVCQDSCNQIR